MLMFMVRSLVSKFNYPYVQFVCSDISGSLMFDPMWEAVSVSSELPVMEPYLAVLCLLPPNCLSNIRKSKTVFGITAVKERNMLCWLFAKNNMPWSVLKNDEHLSLHILSTTYSEDGQTTARTFCCSIQRLN